VYVCVCVCVACLRNVLYVIFFHSMLLYLCTIML